MNEANFVLDKKNFDQKHDEATYQLLEITNNPWN